MTKNNHTHSFHIPVMGLSFTIDSPIRVAQYGIDSVVSIVDDELMERMNAFYSEKFALPYIETGSKSADSRAVRTTSYLNLLDVIVKRKYESFCNELAHSKSAIENFLKMLPHQSALSQSLQAMVCDKMPNPETIIKILHRLLSPGAIDVNIMTKVDKVNYHKNEALPSMYNDAHAALRGFAKSNLNASLVLSAGLNPSLYGYISEFPEFYPDSSGICHKKITLKVSDFRSAMVQGSFLAKKGIWVSEYRIESGLNCGGHAFATEGLLLGPVMKEFQQRKNELSELVNGLLCKALEQKSVVVPLQPMDFKISVQGGVGTSEEHDFLLDYYEVDSVGWGSPFLLVPEATSTDLETRLLLAKATEADLYRSDLSPLGVPFNTIKGMTNDYFKQQRIADGRAGSSCPKKLLALHREHDEKGLCTASRKFQQMKLGELELESDVLSAQAYLEKQEAIVVKSCLCTGLANAAYLEHGVKVKGEAQGVVICPGPGIAYFDKEVSLSEMVQHIYGKCSVLADKARPHFFIKELQLYMEYFRKDIDSTAKAISSNQIKKWKTFKENLSDGINYYETLFKTSDYFAQGKETILEALDDYKNQLAGVVVPELVAAE